MSSHALLNAFKASKPAFGAWITLPGAYHARTVALASPHLSWVLLDCEHGLISLNPGAAESTLGVKSIGDNAPSTIVRIPATGTSTGTGWQIKYALDAGAHGVLVPMIGTAEQARGVVADARYPPTGRRGVGSPFAHHTWDSSLSLPKYVMGPSAGIQVIVQIETAEGLANVEEIAKVEGIDALFIGPFDLSFSLGFPPPSPDPHPEVEKAIQRILAAAHSAGKKCAYFCLSGESAAARAEQGFDMINVTADTNALTEGISRQLAAAAVNK